MVVYLGDFYNFSPCVLGLGKGGDLFFVGCDKVVM